MKRGLLICLMDVMFTIIIESVSFFIDQSTMEYSAQLVSKQLLIELQGTTKSEQLSLFSQLY